MRILAFGHRKRVGKDTAATFATAYIRQYYPKLRVGRLSFGDQLKDISHQMFKWGGLQDAVYYHNRPTEIEETLPPIGLSPREIWDEVGSRIPEISPKVWPEMALTRLPDLDIAISPDLRRPIEVEYVRKFHGICVRIDNPRAPISNHAVDTALLEFDEWDHILTNAGTLKEFNVSVKFVVDRMLES